MLRSEMSDVHNTLSKTNSQYRLSFPQDELLCFHNIHVQYFQNDKDKLYSGLFISYMARNKDPWCIPTAHAHVGLHPTIATLILKYKCILYRHLFPLVLTHIRHMVMVTILFKLLEELSYFKRFMDLKGDIRWASLHVYSKINSK